MCTAWDSLRFMDDVATFVSCLYLAIDAVPQWYIITLMVINGQRDKCGPCTFCDAHKTWSICNYIPMYKCTGTHQHIWWYIIQFWQSILFVFQSKCTVAIYLELIVQSNNSYFQSSIDFTLLSESMHTFLKGEITLDMSDFKSK